MWISGFHVFWISGGFQDFACGLLDFGGFLDFMCGLLEFKILREFSVYERTPRIEKLPLFLSQTCWMRHHNIVL